MPANITFVDNFFDTAVSMQPFIKSQEFKGALLQLESETLYCQVNWERNKVDDSYALGGDISMVYIEGAILNATSNLFRRTGHLNTQLQNFVTDSSY